MSTRTFLILLLVLAVVGLFVYQLRGRPNPVTLTESMKDSLFWNIMSLCRPVSIHGLDFFERVLAGKEKDFWSNESEGVLYIAKEAWAKKHGANIESFPHLSKNGSSPAPVDGQFHCSGKFQRT